MIHRRRALRMLTVLGVALGVLILTMMMLEFVQAQDASIVIVKEADQTVVRGSTATFAITVTNTGDITLTNVTVSDAQVPDCARVIGELASGQDTSYVCARTNVMADFTNSAVVTGTPPVGDDVTDTDTASVNVINPNIKIVKMPDTQVAVRGSTVIFTIIVTNTGDVPLTNVTVSDAPVPDCARAIGTLASGGSARYECTRANVLSDFTNSVTVVGTPPMGPNATDTDTAFVDVISPGIAIAKTPDMQIVAGGSTASFSITVTNTGDATLANVIVSDVRTPSCAWTVSKLFAGEHRRYGCALAGVPDGFINSATVTGTVSKTGERVASVDAAKVRLDETLFCPAGMLAYWKLEESGGVTVYDDFYYGLDGECAGHCPAPVAGQVGGGQVFNGSDTGIDVATVPGDDSLNWGKDDSFSIEFWMRTNGGTCEENEVVVGRADTAAWWVGCRQGGTAAFYLRDSGGVAFSVGGPVVTDGDWHHVVAVRDATADEIRLYVDGSLEGVEPARYYDGFEAPTAVLNIGWLNRTHGYHFDGLVDDIVVYDRALSAGEVWEHRNEGLAGLGRCEPGPYAPIIVSTPVTQASVGRPYHYNVEAVGDPLPTYALLTYPDGMSVDAVTGLISWAPMLEQEGGHTVVVEASNSVGADTQQFTVEVGQGTICPADMLVYWKLDETGGLTYDDFYYHGHDGMCIAGGCPAPVPGVVHGGQEFDGTSTGINVPAHTDFDWGSGASFSIEFWMQTDSSSTCAGNEVVIGRSDTSAWWVGCQNGGAAAFYLRDNSAKSALVTGTVVTDGDWHHVVAVRDADADEIRIYVDGAETGSKSVAYVVGFGSAAELNVGWLDVTGYYHFDGIVDETALYNRALSAGEIQQHHDDGGSDPGYCVTPGIEVDKTANPALIYARGSVVYAYAVANTGDATLSSISWSDDRCDPLVFVGGDGDSDNMLDPTEVWTYTCGMAPSADITNTVIFTGHHALGDTVSDTDVAVVNVINPGIAIDKVAYPTLIEAGDTVTISYTYTVTNPGDDPLSVDVGDDKCGPVHLVGGDTNFSARLDPDETWVYTCSTAVSEGTINEATATVIDSLGHTWVATDTASVGVRYRIFLPLMLRD